MQNANRQFFNLKYDAENRLVEVKKNGAIIAQFTFDADGKRVKSIMGTETVLFVGAHYEVKNGSEITKYYLAGSTRIAMRKYQIPQPMTVEYMLSDHLGSTSLTADADGNKVLEIRYKAWGEIRATWTSNPSTTPAYKMPLYQYTGQASDSYINLLWYGSRHYDPELGRFIQPDSILPVATQGTQAYDRYAYANNNAVRYTDPTGHFIDPVSLTIYAMIGGALIGGAINAYQQYQETGQVDAGQVAYAAVGGAVAAGVIVTGGYAVAAVAGAITAATTATTAAGAACADGDCTNEATAAARVLGQAGEQASGIIKNTQRIPSATGTAAYRIPDQLLPDQGILSEVKNVAHLSLTNQLKDFLAYAQDNGLTFQLITRTNTTFSSPLQELIDDGLIVISRTLK